MPIFQSVSQSVVSMNTAFLTVTLHVSLTVLLFSFQLQLSLQGFDYVKMCESPLTCCTAQWQLQRRFNYPAAVWAIIQIACIYKVKHFPLVKWICSLTMVSLSRWPHISNEWGNLLPEQWNSNIAFLEAKLKSHIWFQTLQLNPWENVSCLF